MCVCVCVRVRVCSIELARLLFFFLPFSSLPPQPTSNEKPPPVAGECHQGEAGGIIHPGEVETVTTENVTSLAMNGTSMKVWEGGREGGRKI